MKGKTNQRVLLFLQSFAIGIFLSLYPSYITPGYYVIELEIFGVFIKNSGSELQIIIIGIAVLQVLSLPGEASDKRIIIEFGSIFGTLLAGINLLLVLLYGWTMYLVIPLILILLNMVYLAMSPLTRIDSEFRDGVPTKSQFAQGIGILGIVVLMVYPFLYSAFSFDRTRYMAAYSISMIYPGLATLCLWIVLQIPKINKNVQKLESGNYYSPILMILLILSNSILLARIFSRDQSAIMGYFRSAEFFSVLSAILVIGTLLISKFCGVRETLIDDSERNNKKQSKNMITVVYPIIIIATLWQGSSMMFSWDPTKPDPFIISASVIGFGFLLCIISLIIPTIKSRKPRVNPE